MVIILLSSQFNVWEEKKRIHNYKHSNVYKRKECVPNITFSICNFSLHSLCFYLSLFHDYIIVVISMESFHCRPCFYCLCCFCVFCVKNLIGWGWSFLVLQWMYCTLCVWMNIGVYVFLQFSVGVHRETAFFV